MRPSRRRSLVNRIAKILLFSCPAALLASHAAAEWPPPRNATPQDLMDPENWPSDPGYGYSYDDDRNGQWNYYSFMPEPNEARPEETASGMSVDMAWRITTGVPSVVIGITDSGIEWDEADLVESAYLNHRELVSHRPTRENGDPCDDLDPTWHQHPDDTPESLEGFDCNGDGILTVADYIETPTLEPEATEDNPRGDQNNNGIFDAGDLIYAYSDGVDDDNNGYVDDISGWDFFKDDNDPYDDTRYGHGTGEAKDSVAQNNDIGDIGVCPHCRYMALRVGDSFITDVDDFGQAAIYATDMRAKIIQSALGTINMNRFTQQALDYAYDNGVLTIASMADENARHHNMPTAANHTLPVHAIQYDGNSIFTAKSFLRYHPCSNYGGQNFLSASGRSCSSEAVGRLAGIAGLLYSVSFQENVGLSPGEAQNLLMMTADDINIPESQKEDSEFRWSQAGFDQRFGYGRVNAGRAVEWVEQGKIPPAVDVTSPTWFSVLYADQVDGPVPIVGTVSAKRASSYDYVVEWAPGVQPLEGDYTMIKEEKNLPQEIVTGLDEPLASLDIRDIDTEHEWDSDSPNGENQYTITVRVRATAHYGGDIGDVPGEMRRTYYVYRDPTLVKGFPLYLGDSGEASPKMADIDGDGIRDLIYPTSGGELHVWRMTPDGPEPIEGFPFKANIIDGLADPPPTPTTPSYLAAPAYQGDAIDLDAARESFTSSAPAVADLDGDGTNEIVVTSYPGTIYAVNSDGSLREGFPIRLPEVPSCSLNPETPTDAPCMSTKTRWARGAFAAPVLEDMDQDGDYDIIQAAFDGNIYVYDGEGNPVDGWPYAPHYTGDLVKDEPDRDRIFTTPATADFNGDGIVDLVVGSNEKLGEGGNSGVMFLIDGRGSNAPDPVLPNWPVSMTSLQLFPLVAEGVPNSGVVGTFGGTLAAVVHGNASLPLLLPADPGPQPGLNLVPPNAIPERINEDTGVKQLGLEPSSEFGQASEAPQPNSMLPLFSQPALADMDQDGTPDVLASGGSLNLAINLESSGATGLSGDNLAAVWSGATGKMLPGSPFILEDYTFFNSYAVADLSGDGYPEALLGSGGYYLHAWDGCGREPEGWPKFTGQWIIPTPAIGDIDGDGRLEVAVGTRSGYVYVWHTEGTESSVIEWESYHHDNRNTGNLDTPLDQGGPPTAASPLTLDMCQVPEEETTELAVTGGCTCDLRASKNRQNGGSPLPAALVGLGVLVGLARRRRQGAVHRA